jgi:hypothetical protein
MDFRPGFDLDRNRAGYSKKEEVMAGGIYGKAHSLSPQPLLKVTKFPGLIRYAMLLCRTGNGT